MLLYRVRGMQLVLMKHPYMHATNPQGRSEAIVNEGIIAMPAIMDGAQLGGLRPGRSGMVCDGPKSLD